MYPAGLNQGEQKMQIIVVYVHSASTNPDPGLHAWNGVKTFIGGLQEQDRKPSPRYRIT